MTNHPVFQAVKDLKPGHCLRVPYQDLADIPSKVYNGHTWLPGDRILENIIGSAYEFYWCEQCDDILFGRLEKPLTDQNLRTYVDPDRREQFTRVSNTIWCKNDNS